MIRVQPVQTSHREAAGDDGPQRVAMSQRMTVASASGSTRPKADGRRRLKNCRLAELACPMLKCQTEEKVLRTRPDRDERQ